MPSAIPSVLRALLFPLGSSAKTGERIHRTHYPSFNRNKNSLMGLL